MTLTHRYGRVLKGYPLAFVCVVRNLLFGFLLAVPLLGTLILEDAEGDGLGPPQYLHLRDKATGKRLARLALGRDDFEAQGRRIPIEYDLSMLGREQFLRKHVRP